MAVPLVATESGDGKPVAILHGLFGAGRNWTGIARRLAARYRVIAFDLRNHGASGWADTMGYAEMAEDVRVAMLARGHHRYALLGHSMGGKVAMTAALADAAAINRLIVVDIAPVAYAIPYRTYLQAMRRLDLAAVTRRGDADRRLAETVPDRAERGFLLQSLVFADGGPRWQLNLAALESAMPTLAGFPALPPTKTYEGPTLFIAGGKSGYLRPEHEAAVRSRFPNARLTRIDDAGHWVHVERADAFLSLAEAFLARGSRPRKSASDAD
jgi:pimeloyl-ACP methyl ester carboxylesterase